MCRNAFNNVLKILTKPFLKMTSVLQIRGLDWEIVVCLEPSNEFIVRMRSELWMGFGLHLYALAIDLNRVYRYVTNLKSVVIPRLE